VPVIELNPGSVDALIKFLARGGKALKEFSREVAKEVAKDLAAKAVIALFLAVPSGLADGTTQRPPASGPMAPYVDTVANQLPYLVRELVASGKPFSIRLEGLVIEGNMHITEEQEQQKAQQKK